MPTRLMTLREILEGIDAAHWQMAVFLCGRVPFTPQTVGAVLDPDDSSPADDPPVPPAAREHGLAYVVTVQAAQDIVENARQQRRVTGDDLLAAFNHYVQNDAFITFPPAG